MTLRELVDAWTPVKAPEIEDSTMSKYARDLRVHVLPVLGDVLIDKISRDMVTHVLANVARTGRIRHAAEDEPRRSHGVEIYALVKSRRATGATYQAIADEVRRRWPIEEAAVTRHVVAGIARRQLSGAGGRPIDLKLASLKRSTVTKVREALRGPFAYAVDRGWLEVNPVVGAKLPPRTRGAKANPKKRIWNPDQCFAFFQSPEVVDDRRFAAWVFAVTSGDRRGGDLGLLWPRIDLRRRRAALTHFCEWDSAKGFVIKDYAKTTDGHEIAIDSFTLGVLKDWKAQQAAERGAATEVHSCAPDDPTCRRPGYHDRQIVFADQNGNYYKPNSFTAGFQNMIRRVNRLHPESEPLPIVDVHSLRHLWNSVADDLAIARTLRLDRLDHASETVNQRYTQAFELSRDDAAEKVAQELFGLTPTRGARRSVATAAGNYDL